MCRLKDGENNFWNPYWINSGTKLKTIIKAVNTMNETSNLSSLIKNQNSDIYRALNMQRIAPLTFLGRFGINHAKTAIGVEDKLYDLKTSDANII